MACDKAVCVAATPGDGSAEIRFTVLGSVRAWRDGIELDLGSRQTRLMAAVFLANAGEFVSVPEIVDVLWPDAPPISAVNVVHRHVGVMRRLFEPDLPPRAAGRFPQRRNGAYRLPVTDESSDLLRFRRIVGQARDEVAAGRPAAAVPLFVTALGEWHGRCAAGLEPATSLYPVFAAVDRERSIVAREAADAALAAGVGDVLAVVRQAAERDPYDEPLLARLMLLLAADGQQAEALLVYQDMGARLAEEIGVDPGQELREAYQQVLRGSGGVRPQPAAREPTAAVPVSGRPAQLPATTRFFNGRAKELAAMSELLPDRDNPGMEVVTVAIDGVPGIGKSTLAVHWAHLAAPLFPDGQLFVNLRGFDPRGDVMDPAEALTGFLGALGVPYRDIPSGLEAQTALYRTMLHGSRMLIVLDNARDAEQVRPLLPGTAGSLVVITSRNRLTGLAAHGAHLMPLDVPSLDDAREEMRRRLGERRTAAEPAALDDIIESCGRLPLAMAIVGARVASHSADTLREIAKDIRRSGTTLDAFQGDEPHADLRTVCWWSYRLLSQDAAGLFRRLAEHPGPDIGLGTIASVSGVKPRAAARLAGELTRTGLLTEYRSHRYLFHDLIRVYAMELSADLDGPGHRSATLDRIADHLLLTAHGTDRFLMPLTTAEAPERAMPGVTPEPVPDAESAMAWFRAEQGVIEALVPVVNDSAGRAWRLASALLPYYERMGMYRAWRTCAEAGLARARAAADPLGEAYMLRMLAVADFSQGRLARDGFQVNFATALERLAHAAGLFARLGEPGEQAVTLKQMGNVYVETGRPAAALARYEEALDLLGDEPHPRAHILYGLGRCYEVLGRFDDAAAVFDEAGEILERVGDVSTLVLVSHGRAALRVALGDLDGALRHHEQARELAEQAGNPVLLCEYHYEVGKTLRRAHLAARAREELRIALAMADRLALVTLKAGIRDLLSRPDLAEIGD